MSKEWCRHLVWTNSLSNSLIQDWTYLGELKLPLWAEGMWMFCPICATPRPTQEKEEKMELHTLSKTIYDNFLSPSLDTCEKDYAAIKVALDNTIREYLSEKAKEIGNHDHSGLISSDLDEILDLTTKQKSLEEKLDLELVHWMARTSPVRSCSGTANHMADIARTHFKEGGM